MNNDNPIYGIDLGTTNSCICLVNERTNEAEVKSNFEGNDLTPSAVYFEKDNPEPIIGLEAKRWAKVAPSLVCTNVKRQMGRNDWEFKVFGNKYRPEAISAMILKKIFADALQKDNISIKTPKAVISVPAYYGSPEREATKIAGEIAGIEVVELIPEPVAAAFSYGFGKLESSKNVLVYDLGGGTFDATIVKISNNRANTIATDGVRLLGGMDWDREIVNFVKSKFLDETGIELPEDNRELEQRLFDEAESAKHSLTSRDKSIIPVFFEGSKANIELSIEKFEEITKHLLNNTLEKTKDVIKQAKEKGEGLIDEMILVGGSSRMRAVKKSLENEFDCNISLQDPDKAIAKGAALVGALIKKGIYNPEVSEAEFLASDIDGKSIKSGHLATLSFVNAKSLGIEVKNLSTDQLFVDYLIPRNSTLPVSKTGHYYASVENQTGLDLKVMEQRAEESSNPEENTIIHDRDIGFPNPVPKGSPINVTYLLNKQGILHITVEEPVSKEKWEIDVEAKGQLTESEISALKKAISI